jgi:hypothetical protein
LSAQRRFERAAPFERAASAVLSARRRFEHAAPFRALRRFERAHLYGWSARIV